MQRRIFLAAGAAAVLVGLPARAVVPLEALSRYFNDITTLKARFRQYNADGTQSTGTLYMRRPGRARFEYDPPDRSLVMAGGSRVLIFDGRSNVTAPEEYPLKRTPLNIVLERNVELDRPGMIVGHSGDDQFTMLVAQDPKAPENGRVEMVFRNDPLTFTGWTVIDGQGTRTRVELSDIVLGEQLAPRLFDIVAESRDRARNR